VSKIIDKKRPDKQLIKFVMVDYINLSNLGDFGQVISMNYPVAIGNIILSADT